MNEKHRSIIALSFIGGVTVVPTLIESIQVIRRERKKREGIQIKSDLDHIALLRTSEALKKDLADGMYDHLSFEDQARLFTARFEFEKIAIRLES